MFEPLFGLINLVIFAGAVHRCTFHVHADSADTFSSMTGPSWNSAGKKRQGILFFSPWPLPSCLLVLYQVYKIPEHVKSRVAVCVSVAVNRFTCDTECKLWREPYMSEHRMEYCGHAGDNELNSQCSEQYTLNSGECHRPHPSHSSEERIGINKRNVGRNNCYRY